MKLQYRPREDRIETAIRLPPSKRAIDTSVVNLRASVLILFNRQFLPLTAGVQQLQNVTKEGVQGELRRRTVALGERRLIAAVDRRRTGIDHVLAIAQTPRKFDDGKMPDYVGTHIGKCVGERVTDASLGRQVYNPRDGWNS